METGLIIGISAAIVLLLIFLAARKKTEEISPDEMDGRGFEQYCAHLLSGNGWEIVSVSCASGDYGADILAEKDGITYAIQCKRYEEPVGQSVPSKSKIIAISFLVINFSAYTLYMFYILNIPIRPKHSEHPNFCYIDKLLHSQLNPMSNP